MLINLNLRGLLDAGVAVAISVMLSLPVFAAGGKAIYDANCKICHDTGTGGAPILQDKKQWTERLEKGMAGLVEIAINGVQGYGGSMPPRGGNPNLSDEQVEAAVAYMVEQVN